MLNNPQWDKTRADLITFLESKPSAEQYQWQYAEICACGQFFGHAQWRDENNDFAERTGIDVNLTALECATKLGTGGIDDRSGTFGALLAKVKATA